MEYRRPQLTRGPRRALLFAALGLASALASACANGVLGRAIPTVQNTDILVIAPAPTSGATPEYPPQVIHASSASLQSGNVDLVLSKGSLLTGVARRPDGTGVANAAVRVKLRGAALDTSVQTDVQGNFSVQLGPGEYDVTVTPDHNNNPNLPPRVFQDVIVGETDIDRDFVLSSGYHITGVVHTGAPDNTLLSGWHVTAREEGGVQTSTAADTSLVGHFDIAVTGTGSWIVTLQPPANLGAPWPVATRRVLVTGTAGVGNFDFTYPAFAVPAATPPKITGTVTGAGMPTVEFANITVRAKATIPSGDPDTTFSFDKSIVTDAAGTFALPVIAGTYDVYIEPAVDFPYSHAVIPGIGVNADYPVGAAATTLKPKASISGTAAGAAGETVDGARIHLAASDGTIYQFSKRTDASGAFTVSVNVGSYDVDIEPAPDSGLVRTATTLTVDHDAADIAFLVPSGAKVSGRVLAADGSTPIAGATVVGIDPNGDQQVGAAESISDGGGHWILSLPVSP